MANWAVVIGVDRYEMEHASLKGAVNDALSVRDWLVDAAGGNVPEENVALVLSPLPGTEQAGNFAEATKDGLVTAVADLIRRSGGEGDRLYFFYAGHGLTARVNQRDENALLGSDFTTLLTDNSLALRSLWEFFETLQFADQFFFVDACRNVPWEGVEFEVGRWPLPRKRNPGVPPAQQFILYATSPGLKAQELREAGNERGAFTEVLLDGLRGSAKAKAWSSENENYQVRWERLVDYVKNELEKRRLAVPDAVAQDAFQIPQDAGARGVAGRDRNPVLAEFPKDAFEPEKLEILLRPDEVVPVAEVMVIDELGVEVDRRAQLPGLPVEFTLPPKTYALHAVAPEYDRAVARPPVELYAASQVPLDLSRAAAAPQPGNGGGAATRGLGEASTAELVVRTSDALAPVEVADATGKVVGVSPGVVSLRELPPGFYRARLLTPGQDPVEEVVELPPGASRTIDLEPASAPRAAEDLAQALGAPVGEDNTVVSAQAGTIASPHVSTILALAAGVALQAGAPEGAPAADLGFKGFREAVPPDAESALYVLVGSASADGGGPPLTGARLRLWRFGEPVPDTWSTPTELSDAATAGEFACATTPGAHWLSVEPPDGAPMALALAMLPERLTLLTLVARPGTVEILQYMPSLTGGDSAHPGMLRRLELMQRILLSGRLDAGYELARDLLDGKFDDPLAGCLGGYMAIRLGKASELGPAVENLRAYFGGLADSHVLRGEYEAAAGDADAAKAAFEQAIEVGVPIFGEGLTRLIEASRTYGIEHENVRLARRIFELHMSGSMWSVWLPESFTPGALLGS